MTDFVWNDYEKITMQEYKNFIREGELIPVDIQELEYLQVLEKKMDLWLENVQNVLKRGNEVEELQKFYKLIQENHQNQEFIDQMKEAQ